MDEQRRRATDYIPEGAYVLAILYTLGYFAFLGVLMFRDIPPGNKELLLTLAGILSAAQLGIIKYYYDGSKGAENAQVANIARASRTDGVLQEIAKAAPTPVVVPVPIPAGTPIKAADVTVAAEGNVTVEQPKGPS